MPALRGMGRTTVELGVGAAAASAFLGMAFVLHVPILISAVCAAGALWALRALTPAGGDPDSQIDAKELMNNIAAALPRIRNQSIAGSLNEILRATNSILKRIDTKPETDITDETLRAYVYQLLSVVWASTEGILDVSADLDQNNTAIASLAQSMSVLATQARDLDMNNAASNVAKVTKQFEANRQMLTEIGKGLGIEQ